MEKLEYEIEFITPAFIGGADQQAELRPASFVGLLRWWWRALKGWRKPEDLLNEESEIFGGAGDKGKAGKVWLKIKDKDIEVGKDIKGENGLEWGYNKRLGRLDGKHAGIGYLFFSVLLQRRDYLKPEGRFVLELVGKKEYLAYATASLWALSIFGGVGTRARRGGGNIRVVNSQESFMDMVPKEPFSDWLRSQYEKALSLVQGKGLIKSVYVSKRAFNNWVEALNDIGKAFMEYRTNNKHRIFDMGAFGLPIRHRGNIFLTPQNHNRRASPLIFRTIRVRNRYRWMVVWLDGPFLPRGEKLRFKRKLGNVNLKPIEEFLSTLDAQKIAFNQGG